MSSVKRKVYAYITHGERLLIFGHPDSPEAGLQVPGGTVEAGEEPADAVMREAAEETGLTGLRLGGRLGETCYWVPELGQWHQRTFFHLICMGRPPERWYHAETVPSDGSPGPIRFAFTWVALPDGVPELSGGLDQMLPELVAALKLIECYILEGI
ncbi:MAG: NUDIX domain-containing protein [Anaerolineae bacterium]|nr:NUDIX domain-containing protein [Anaerolineae bacterium]